MLFLEPKNIYPYPINKGKIMKLFIAIAVLFVALTSANAESKKKSSTWLQKAECLKLKKKKK